ncbi:MAG: hypothetical protein O2921_03665 [Chloroflexi bacterium]|nr:hypothetical protein [Chloroflexota bacterium]MDA1281710.1 hypothetical protein [Chloroflexota bacterium]
MVKLNLVWKVLITVLILGSASCGVQSQPARQGEPEIVATRWLALLEGRIELSGDCVQIVGTKSDTPYSLIWNPDHHLIEIRGDQIRIVDKVDNVDVTWTLGQTITIGGGGVNAPPESAIGSIFERCPDPFWIVGSVR